MLDQMNNVFIIGIKGVAMANIAVILKKMGHNVIGADTDEQQITDEVLKNNNIKFVIGFNLADLSLDTDSVIYSAAHGGKNNPIVQEAIRRGIKVFHQAEFLGELLKNFKTTIAVCGSHGKTTTTSLLAYSLIKLGVRPSYLVGTSSFSGYPAGDYNLRDYFVLEADEYAVDPPSDNTPKLHFLRPDYILCTNIDFDHPDVFRDKDHVQLEFDKFFKNAKKKVILCPENEDPSMDKHMSNRIGVTRMLLELGFEKDEIQKAIGGFSGSKRRFEQKAYVNDTYLFDDYAHHPEEIKATIKMARDRFKDRRIVVLFQSHTYSRTKALLDEFAQTLSQADVCLIAPIFPSARENPDQFKVTSHDIVRVVNKKSMEAFDTFDQMLERLPSVIKRGDVIFTMGAGDIYKLDRDIIKIVKTI